MFSFTFPRAREIFLTALFFTLAGCATLTEDANTSIALSFSDNAAGKCVLTNKRGTWEADVPTKVSVRKSDDVLNYDCDTDDGRNAVGAIPSTMGGKIVARAIILDIGVVVDSITDKHRKYPASFVIPIE